MEPMTGESVALPEDESGKKASPVPSRAQDRVSISGSEAQRLDRWLKHVHEASKGFLTISRSDFVAFLIREHREELTPAEIKRIRSEHYDPIRHIQWIMPQIKVALAQGDAARVAELQEELRSVELSLMGPATFALAYDAPGANGESSSSQARPKSKKRAKKQADSDAVSESKNATCIAEIEEKQI